MAYCYECDNHIDDDELSEADELLRKWKHELQNFVDKMERAKRPFESELGLYSILVYDDELNDMKELFKKILVSL